MIREDGILFSLPSSWCSPSYVKFLMRRTKWYANVWQFIISSRARCFNYTSSRSSSEISKWFWDSAKYDLLWVFQTFLNENQKCSKGIQTFKNGNRIGHANFMFWIDNQQCSKVFQRLANDNQTKSIKPYEDILKW